MSAVDLLITGGTLVDGTGRAGRAGSLAISADRLRVIEAGEILQRIAAVKEENLKRLDDDVDILKAYLKTQHGPHAAIEALEGLTVEQHVSWKKAIDRIKKLAGGVS